MTVKEYLKEIRKMDAVIRNKLIEIQQLDDMKYSITAPLGNEVVQTSPNNDKIADLIAKIDELEEITANERSNMLDARRERIKVIEQLPDANQYDLLHMMYVQQKSLKGASIDIGVAYDTAKDIHGKALEYIRKNVTVPGVEFTRKPPTHTKSPKKPPFFVV